MLAYGVQEHELQEWLGIGTDMPYLCGSRMRILTDTSTDTIFHIRGSIRTYVTISLLSCVTVSHATEPNKVLIFTALSALTVLL